MENVELLQKIVARQEAEVKALVNEYGVDETVAEVLVVAGIRLGAFQAGVLSAMGCMQTLADVCPE